MKPKRYSILYDSVRRVYVPQYSYDGRCWYSFRIYGHHEATIVFSSKAHAKRFVHKQKDKKMMRNIVPMYSSMPSIIPGQRVLVVDYGDRIEHMNYDDCLSCAQAIDIYRRIGGGL